MPKRSRKDEGKQPLSALAQRRSQKAVISEEPKPPPPAPPLQPPAIPPEKQPSAPIRIPAPESPSKQLAEEMIQQKRQEIEKKIAARSAKNHHNYFRQGQFEVLDGRSGGGSTEESAVARLKKRADEAAAAAAAAAAVDREDGGMMSLDENSSGEGVEGEDVSLGDGENSTPKVIQVSNFITTSENYYQEGGYSSFGLLAGETLVLVGEYWLEVVSGRIDISGASLTRFSGMRAVYAPLTHALPVIVCLGRVKGSGSRKANSYDANIIVSNRDSGIRDVGKLVPMFSNIWKIAPSQSADREQNNIASFHPIFSSSNPPTILSIPQPWEATLCTISQKLAAFYDRPRTPPYASTPSGAFPPIILISGGKSTGKSTFARILTNKLRTAFPEYMVSYLDIDPGQPEFSAPGIIALYTVSSPVLGPPFTHPNPSERLLKKAHYIGYTTPKEDPSHYMSAVTELLQVYRESAFGTPLVINTCGWTKGIGLELLSEIIQLSAPSDVVLLSHAKDTTTSTSSITDLIPESVTLHNLPSSSSSSSSSSPSIPSKYTPSDLRALQTSSYLHFTPLAVGGGGREQWDFKTRLVSRRPWVVSYAGPKPGILGVSILGEQLSPVEVETAINGLLVGIVFLHNSPATQLPPPPPGSSEIPLYPHPPIEKSFCGGTVLIRAIDTKRQELHIISSLAQNLLKYWERNGYRVVLVRGRMEMPIWEYLGVEGGEQEMLWVAESGSGSGGAGRKGAAVWKVRRNVMRRGQMRLP